MRRWPFLLLILLVLGVGGRAIYGMINAPDDKTLIKEALADAVKAGKEGRPGSVIDKLSDNFKINGQEPGTNQIAKFIRDSRPDVQIKDTDPIVSGDTAQITSDVAVSATILGQPFNQTLKDVQLLFKKESGTDWLIFPTTKWHLSAARVPDSEVTSLTGRWSQ